MLCKSVLLLFGSYPGVDFGRQRKIKSPVLNSRDTFPIIEVLPTLNSTSDKHVLYMEQICQIKEISKVYVDTINNALWTDQDAWDTDRLATNAFI